MDRSAPAHSTGHPSAAESAASFLDLMTKAGPFSPTYRAAAGNLTGWMKENQYEMQKDDIDATSLAYRRLLSSTLIGGFTGMFIGSTGSNIAKLRTGWRLVATLSASYLGMSVAPRLAAPYVFEALGTPHTPFGDQVRRILDRLDSGTTTREWSEAGAQASEVIIEEPGLQEDWKSESSRDRTIYTPPPPRQHPVLREPTAPARSNKHSHTHARDEYRGDSHDTLGVYSTYDRVESYKEQDDSFVDEERARAQQERRRQRAKKREEERVLRDEEEAEEEKPVRRRHRARRARRHEEDEDEGQRDSYEYDDRDIGRGRKEATKNWA